jgi:hypothetical protein
MPVITAHRRLRQEDYRLNSSLSYIVSSRLAWTLSQKKLGKNIKVHPLSDDVFLKSTLKKGME